MCHDTINKLMLLMMAVACHLESPLGAREDDVPPKNQGATIPCIVHPSWIYQETGAVQTAETEEKPLPREIGMYA